MALDTLRTTVRDYDGKLDYGGKEESSKEKGFTAYYGSRIDYRLWGAKSDIGRRAAPLTVWVKVTACADGSSIDVTASSDEGGFLLYRAKINKRVLEERMAQTINEFKATTT